MNKYRVYISCHGATHVDIEAETEDEAIEIADYMDIACEDLNFELKYEVEEVK